MFKEKNRKPFVGDNRVTLDAKHNEMARHFKERYKTLSPKVKELKHLTKKYNELKNIPNKDLTDEMLQEKFSLVDSINNLKIEIEKIQNCEEEFDYFLQTGHLLYQYYDNIESVAKNKNKEVSTTSVVDFFSKNDDKQEQKDMSDFVTTTQNFKRADILNNYMKIIDPNYIGNINYDVKYDKCQNCNCEKTLVQDEGIMVCEYCGHTDFIVIDSDRPSYKDPPPEVSYFAYKRSNHFRPTDLIIC